MAREYRESKKTGLYVEVQPHDSFAKVLSKFKRKVNDSGILKEVQERRFYVKPSDARKVSEKAARRRWLKQQEKNKLK